ncbi:MAG: molecular chaperone HtpG [Acidobacteria bacterium]|nr:MAG: molecular chaperone HtpG [Acidobacteriota bacterium]
MTTNIETFQFQAEARQVLDLMIHSLYTNKEIFLRELISNASDALDRLRFEALSHPELMSADDKLEIWIESDSTARTLTIHDNGIGMSRDEVIANIGTIAKSGTRELLQSLKENQSPGALSTLIGQFGVGFYSAFMVADRVTLVTRRAGESDATQWESAGDGAFTIGKAAKFNRGTSITLHLKKFENDAEVEDFTDTWVVSRIVKRYSDFVAYPIIYKQKDAKEPAKPLNSMKPIWTRPRSEVTNEEYNEFYKHISHDWTEPMETWSFRAEGRSEYQALLFIPSQAPFDLFFVTRKFGLHLYVRRVLIMEHCEELLPAYLRFVHGVVDSADLPLNVSRQRLQEDRHITQIRKWLTKKTLDSLEEMLKSDSEKYRKFWSQFGRVLKEGASLDFENKDRLVSLYLFESSEDPEKLTTLRDYVGRMKENQSFIYYLTGPSRRAVEHSPHLEAFKEKRYEVLYLVDAVDELLVQALPEFDGKKMKSVGKGTADLGEEKDLKEKAREYSKLISALATRLEDRVKEVRLSSRLTSSPACLVVSEHDVSPNLEKLLSQTKGDSAKQKRIMELNPNHEIILKMRDRAEDAVIDDFAEVLFGYALLAEGSDLQDPLKFNQAVMRVLAKTIF